MKATHETQKLFYQSLGKLFYAIAAADKVVKEEEINVLKNIVNTEWLFLDGIKNKDEIADMRHLKIIFNQLLEQKQNPNTCLTDFKLFKMANENLFTSKVKLQIWKTANAIATAFSNKNKSELIILFELSNILE